MEDTSDATVESARQPEEPGTPYWATPSQPDDPTVPLIPPTIPAPYGWYTSPPPPPSPTPQRMPREEAISLSKRLKAGLVALSVVGMGIFTALVAGHVTGVTAAGATTTPANSAAPSQSGGTNGASGSQTSPSSPSNPDNGGGFFNTSPSNGANNGNSNNGGFGVSQNPPSQGPVSGTGVS